MHTKYQNSDANTKTLSHCDKLNSLFMHYLSTQDPCEGENSEKNAISNCGHFIKKIKKSRYQIPSCNRVSMGNKGPKFTD